MYFFFLFSFPTFRFRFVFRRIWSKQVFGQNLVYRQKQNSIERFYKNNKKTGNLSLPTVYIIVVLPSSRLEHIPDTRKENVYSEDGGNFVNHMWKRSRTSGTQCVHAYLINGLTNIQFRPFDLHNLGRLSYNYKFVAASKNYGAILATLRAAPLQRRRRDKNQLPCYTKASGTEYKNIHTHTHTHTILNQRAIVLDRKTNLHNIYVRRKRKRT